MTVTTLRLLPDLEDALRQIPGIKAASVVTSADATPTEIHVLANTAKSAKQIVRDIQSLAMARYDLDIDHRIVSVVQFDEPDEGDSAEADIAPPRPVVSGITIHMSGETATATITVTLGGGSFEGSASGSASLSARPRLVANATLGALHELLGTPAEVDHAAVVQVGGRAVAVSVLTLNVPRQGEQLMTGSALVRGDEADAVARSVLDALNRRLAG
ncbi:MAG: hypothetical protein QOG53_3050 [Frankiales bacterium]|jgi:hypothetical protein|nr:hypothetical protein [Frankiales bacterium]